MPETSSVPAALSAYDRAFAFVLEREGGFANVKADRGGATMQGVTTETYNTYRDAHGLPRRPVREIEEHELRDIYEAYWRAAMCDRIAAAGFEKLALCVMDFGFNSGDGTARKYLQEVVGAVPDKIIGPKTLAAIEALGETETIRRYLDRRALYLHRVIAHNSTQRIFHENWMARLRHCARAAGIPIGATYEKGHLHCVT